MALTDTASFAALSRLGSGWELLTHTVDAPEVGWDVWSGEFIRDFGAEAVTAGQVAAMWSIGRRPDPAQDFWTVTRKPTRIAGNVWRLAVTAHGATAGKPVKILVSSSVSAVTIRNLGIGPPFGPPVIYDTANIKDSAPGMRVTYVLIGEPAPTDKLGVASWNVTPPASPRTPAYLFGNLTKFAVNLPVGWSRDGIDSDVLPGTDVPVSLVTESWTWQQFRTPN